jgi:hypothetical protein
VTKPRWIVILVACLSLAIPTLARQQSGGSEGITTQESQSEQSEQPNAGRIFSTHFAPGFQVDRDTYRAVCEQPKDREHADLCQQWRVAEAAETQIFLSVLGLILLAFTLVFTAIAAVAAWRTVNTMRRTSERQLRAYVSFVGPAFQISKVGDDEQIVISVEARMKNAGQTPAHNCIISIGWLEADAGQPTPTIIFQDRLATPVATVGPNIEFVSRRDRKPVATVIDASFARRRLYLFVRCDYEDISGKARFTKVCLRTHPEFKPQNITPQNFDSFQMAWSCPIWGDYSADN